MAEIIVTEKRCPRCKQVKPISEWYKSKGRYDGLANYCKACAEIRRKLYLLKPGVKEARQAYHRQRYQKNREKLLEQTGRRKKTPRARELNRLRRVARRDIVLEQQRAYRMSEHGNLKRKDYAKKYSASPEYQRKRRDNRFRRLFGISLDEYEAIFASQNGKCAICLREQKRWLSIDHNHTDGKVRGLLCARCNFALGYLDDSPELADRAAAYLRKHAQLRLVV